MARCQLRDSCACLQWVNKLLDEVHDDLELKRFLQSDGSWPTRPLEAQEEALAANLTVSRTVASELCLVRYYSADGGAEPALCDYYGHPEQKGFFDQAAEGVASIFSNLPRLSFSAADASPTEDASDIEAEELPPEPEPEPGQEAWMVAFYRKDSGVEEALVDYYNSGAMAADNAGFMSSVLSSPLFSRFRASSTAATDGSASGQEASADADEPERADDDGADDEDDGGLTAAAPAEPRPLVAVKRLKVFAYQTRTDEKGKEYTVYQVRCFPVDELSHAPWVVSRRFTAFAELRDTLGSAIAKLPFPSRRMSLWGSGQA